MIDLAIAIQERLRERVGASLAALGSVTSLAALDSMPRVAPAAYVVPLADSPGANSSGDAQTTVQLRGFAVGVVLRVKHAGDATGIKATGALHELRQAAADVLLGWQIDPATCTPLRFAGGSLLDSAGGFVTWQDDFEGERLHQHVQTEALG